MQNQFEKRRTQDNLLYKYVNCIALPIFLVFWLAWCVTHEYYQSLVLWFILLKLAGIHMSTFAHRSWCHRAWAPTKRWLNVLAIGIYTLLFNMPAIGFVALHREHHRFSDSDRDPHSPYYMNRWAVTFYPQFKMDPSYVADLIKDRDHMWFTKHYWSINLAWFLVLFLISPAWLALWLAFVAAFGITARHVNNLGHNDLVNKRSTNSFLWSIFYIDGEPWHANHHDDPRDWRFGRKWWQLDASKYLIWSLTKVGLAKIKTYN
jgi:stearoyl-CoA desaturase (delta-9 desaturase)